MAPKQIAPELPYKVWFDCHAYYSAKTFATAEEAVSYSEQCRGSLHYNRVQLNGEDIAITIPTHHHRE